MKQRILLTEFCPTQGHANLFSNTLRLLQSNFDVVAVTTCDNKKIEGMDFVKAPFSYYKSKKNYYIDTISFLFYSFRVLKRILKICEEENINTIICLTYDELSLFLFGFLIPSRIKVYLMSHVNIDNYDRLRLKKWMFNRFKGRYSHIVQCGFIANYLNREYQLENVLVWPHPLNKLVIPPAQKNIDCAGLSFSNDETVISRLIEIEKTTQLFKNKKIKVFLKSQETCFDDGFLTVVKGRLKSEEYDDIINRTKSILMPFPSSFKMRMSGTLIDSLTNKKVVFASPIPVVLESHKAYPSLIRIFCEDSFVEDLCGVNSNQKVFDEFDAFISFHDDDNLAKIMADSLKSSLSNKPIINKYDF